jgi:MGT family glycosyltransferase
LDKKKGINSVRIVIYSLPQHGHINPTLAVCKELAKRGHEIVYYMTEEFQEKIEKSGGIFKPLGTSIDIYREAQKAIDSHPNVPGLLPTDAFGVFMQFMAEVMSRIDYLDVELNRFHPDLIIYDPMSIFGQILAKGHDYKRATFYTTYPMIPGDKMSGTMSAMFVKAINPRLIRTMIWLFWSFTKALFKYRLRSWSPSRLFTAKERLNLVPLPKGIMPNAAELDDNYLFFGPNLMLDYSHKGEKLPPINGKKYLYVSMGSTPLNNQPELFRAVIEGFCNSEWHVVMNIGEANRESLGDIPSNIIVRNYVPQIDVLKQADVFLTHGGMNSVMESCYFGVPMIVLALQPETKITATQINTKGIGISIHPTELKGEKLRNIADTILGETSYRDKIHNLQDELRSLGGAIRACDVIEEYMQNPISSGR